MKIHIEKNKTKERNSLLQLLRVSSATEAYEMYAWCELNEKERQLFEEDPRLKDKLFIEYEYRGSDLSPEVSMMVDRDDNGFRFVAYNARELKELEKEIKERAEALKYRILEVGDTEGSSTTEI